MEDAEDEKKFIMDNLGLKYKPLIGMDFGAIYKGGFEMPLKQEMKEMSYW